MNAIARNAAVVGACILTVSLGVSLVSTGSIPPTKTVSSSWNRKTAAAYLDQRMGWWMAWPAAARSHGTFCVSCHTALPYALARAALRSALKEPAPSPNERKLLDNVTKRVRLWKEVQPFYGEGDGLENIQSRGTESILNALILATFDAQNGRLSNDARAAFDNMWALQLTAGDERGAWPWLNFDNEPWEARDSQFYGASLAAIAVGTAPGEYRATPGIQNNLKSLFGYLSRQRTKQSLINQVVLVWASTKMPQLIAPEQRQSMINNVLSKQRDDGGWSLSSLAWTWRGTSPTSLLKLWTRSEDTPLQTKSDGYATGLIAYTLEQARLPRTDAHLERGLAWLVRNQDSGDGHWPGYSLNHKRSASSDTGRFMSDAATAYAVLALSGTDLPY